MSTTLGMSGGSWSSRSPLTPADPAPEAPVRPLRDVDDFPQRRRKDILRDHPAARMRGLIGALSKNVPGWPGKSKGRRGHVGMRMTVRGWTVVAAVALAWSVIGHPDLTATG